MNIDVILRVTSVRSQNPKGFGGCIFSGRSIDESGNVLDAKKLYVVVASYQVINDIEVQDGQWWAVNGRVESYQVNRDGYRYTEYVIHAMSVHMRRISGRHIVRFLADHVTGMGTVKALRLWNAYGAELYEYLDASNIKKLAQIVNVNVAMKLVKFWEVEGDTATLQWLQDAGFDVRLGQKLLAFYKKEARSKIEEDPYRLLAFCGEWRKVDSFATGRLGIGEDDQRRLQGAVEEALYQLFEKGHTAASTALVEQRLKRLLSPVKQGKKLRHLINECLDYGFSNGAYTVGATGLLHAVGPMYMEAYVAEFLANRINASKKSALLPTHIVDAILNEHETKQGVRLNDEQREAVHLANVHGLALITGAAGTGKTTVLQVLYKIYDEAKVNVVQMALAGKASIRMAEATGRTAQTIASWLNKDAEDKLVDRSASLADPINLKGRVIVIDEASMVDIMTMYRLCRAVGQDGRLVMTGDPAQLMPVGPGLILHELIKTQGVPVVQLKTVKRYGGMIAQVANDVRDGKWLDLPESGNSEISFISSKPGAAADLVMSLYEEDPNNTQILNPKRLGPDGVRAINARCQQRYTGHAPKITYQGDNPEGIYYMGFNLGDPVICTFNRWDTGTLNGSTGRVSAILAKPREVLDKDGKLLGTAIAEIIWDDGQTRPMLIERLDDLELAYSITVHKSQGSQWPNVIVVLTKNLLLDRTLIYTAITRARSKVIMIGNLAATKAAAEALPKYMERTVALGNFLVSILVPADQTQSERPLLLAATDG